ncbi:conserved hypothetical protein [Uncinocarpus reesii 1704]|uniref:Uncharacterized protein n=1 Tax=Uncinocarpus reesii (strain UAMH 1704) TaxID=336963 RepID=C4JLW1_UNCRE|nr:uncharacterized protein UREG_03819 [Uncinocarpus reesii 1704]EEP78973.1 conserved hypothetical protein [Uncinocarpus reesii 1704]
MAFFRQVWTLFVKNVLITLVRPWLTTSIRAFLLPVVFVAFLSYARNLFIPPAKFGIGEPTPIRSLPNALDAVSGGRDKVVFVNSGFTGGAIDRVIAQVAEPVRSSGKKVEILSSPDQLADSCKSTLLGTSYCIAAAVFYASPTEDLANIGTIRSRQMAAWEAARSGPQTPTTMLRYTSCHSSMRWTGPSRLLTTPVMVLLLQRLFVTRAS